MLRIRGLTKSYGERHVLRGVDLDVAPGQVVGLLGPNGAGKTTLVSIVAGLLSADAGEVSIGGVNALAHPTRARRSLGIAPQELGIYPVLTVERNLAIFGELSGLRGRRLRERVHEVAEALDLGDLLSRQAAVLSGGQKRRLHTAMALVHRPRLLFLDEPTVGADVHSRGRILAAVSQLAEEGCAVVYTSHYLPEIEDLAARVAVLEGGRIVAEGSVAELVGRFASPALRLTFAGTVPQAVLAGFEVNGREAILRTSDPAAAAAAVLSRLNGEAGSLRGLDIVRPDLETAYLALTGRRGVDIDISSTEEVRSEPVA